MHRKFEVGDKVRLNDQAPRYIDLVQGRPRTIVAIRPGRDGRAAYILGSNGKGECKGEPPYNGFACYALESWQLRKYNPRRYHFHRQYRRKEE